MLGRDDLRIARLKAAMWESRNLERLLSKAVRSYIDPADSNQVKKDVAFFFENQGGKNVLVKNVPHINHNGEVYENLHLTSTIEEIIEEEYESLPDSIEFEELLK